MRIGVKEEKRCPRLLYRNCIIISGIFERRSSKPRLIFASYKRHVPPICRAEVGSKIKVCHPLYPARNRAIAVAQRSKSTLRIRPRIFALFSFSNSILLRFIGLTRICVEFVSQENLFHDRISSFVSPSSPYISVIQTEYHLDFQSRWPESKFTSVGLIDRFGSPYQLRARCRELFSLYATVAANFRESKRTENCSSLSLYAGHSPTALRYATLLSTRSVLTTRAYIYLLTALSLPPPPPPASPAR